MSAYRSWVVCLFPDAVGLLSGSKIHLSQCLSCPMEGCPRKAEVFAAFFPEHISADRAGLNRKLMDLNDKLDAARRKADLYCPRKGSLTTKCVGVSVFCRFNLVCGRFKERTGRMFIQSLRWRRIMVYVVKFRNGTVKTLEKTDLASLDVDAVEVVYPGTLEVEVVTELVPQGEEEARFKETVATFREKYRGKVVSEKGLVDFEAWFASASTGDRALVPERALVPVKTYRIIKIKGEKIPVPRQSPVPAEVAALNDTKPTVKAEKPKKEEISGKAPAPTPVKEAKKESPAKKETKPAPAPVPASKKKQAPAVKPGKTGGKKK